MPLLLGCQYFEESELDCYQRRGVDSVRFPQELKPAARTQPNSVYHDGRRLGLS